MSIRLSSIALICMCLMLGGLAVGQSLALFDLDSLEGLWLFDEGNGNTAVDASGKGLDGKLIGSPKWVDGQFGKALEFDGAGAYVEIPAHSNPTKAITVSVWVQSPSPAWNQHGFLVSKRDAYILHPNLGSNAVAFPVFNGGGWNVPNAWDTGSVGPDDITEWHMYTGTYDSATGEWKIYIDGEEASALDLTKNEIAEDIDVLWIGRDQCCDPRFGSAIVDEVAIFNVALTQDEIQTIMDNGLDLAVLAVQPNGKMTTTWGSVKAK